MAMRESCKKPAARNRFSLSRKRSKAKAFRSWNIKSDGTEWPLRPKKRRRQSPRSGLPAQREDAEMSKATRQAFGESLAKLGEQHPEIVVLDADLAKSTKSEIFAKKFPTRFFEMGIAEANMIGTASGLAFA